MARRSSSGRPILCAVLDAVALGSAPTATAMRLFGAGVDWIQLRDRSLESEACRRLVCALLDARDRTVPANENRAVIVNKRVDIALSTRANGVHLGFDALDAISARSLLPASASIGVSLHSINEVQSFAESMRTQETHPLRAYAHLAPVWDPNSKPASRPPLGIDSLKRACALGLPILAQGGLDHDRATLAIAAGAAGIAVTGILAGPGNPTAAVRQLREALDQENG